MTNFLQPHRQLLRAHIHLHPTFDLPGLTAIGADSSRNASIRSITTPFPTPLNQSPSVGSSRCSNDSGPTSPSNASRSATTSAQGRYGSMASEHQRGRGAVTVGVQDAHVGVEARFKQR
jgi:hypothetical protein